MYTFPVKKVTVTIIIIINRKVLECPGVGYPDIIIRTKKFKIRIKLLLICGPKCKTVSIIFDWGGLSGIALCLQLGELPVVVNKASHPTLMPINAKLSTETYHFYILIG